MSGKRFERRLVQPEGATGRSMGAPVGGSPLVARSTGCSDPLMRTALVSALTVTLLASSFSCTSETAPPAPVTPASQPASASSLPSGHSTSTAAVSLDTLFVAPTDLPEVIAKVENREVTREDFVHELRQMQIQLTATGLPPGLDRRQVLAGALFRTVDLQLQGLLAEELGVERDPKAEAAWLEDMDRRMKADPAFETFLLRAGKTEAQRAIDARRQTLMAGIMDKVRVSAKANLREKAKGYYDRHPGDYVERAGTEVWRIFVKAPRGMLQRDRDIARARADDLRTRAKKNPDQFENLAIGNSDGGKASTGGYLGFVPEGALNEALYARIAKAKKGTILPLHEDASGFAIIRVGRRRKERVVPFEEVEDSILEKVYAPFIRQEVEKRIAAMRADKKVEVLAPGLEYAPR